MGDEHSDDTPVTSGVPQGSVLGPTLFVYFINDMPDVISCLIKIFADDTKVYSYTDALSSEQRTLLVLVLQSSVDRLLVWLKKQMTGR